MLSLSGDEQFRSTILMQKIFEVDVFARLDTMEAQLQSLVTATGAAPACVEGQRRGGAKTCSKCAGRTQQIDANYCWKCGERLEPLQECSKQKCENVLRGAGAGGMGVALEGRTAIADLVIVKPTDGGDGNARAVPRHVTVHGLQEGLDAENETVGQAIYVTAASAGAGFGAADKGVRSFSIEIFCQWPILLLSRSTDKTYSPVAASTDFADACPRSYSMDLPRHHGRRSSPFDNNAQEIGLQSAAEMGCGERQREALPAKAASIFDELDLDASDTLSRPEVHTALRKYGFSQASIDEIFDAADINHDNSLSLEEFTASLLPTILEAKEVAARKAAVKAEAEEWIRLSMQRQKQSQIQREKEKEKEGHHSHEVEHDDEGASGMDKLHLKFEHLQHENAARRAFLTGRQHRHPHVNDHHHHHSHLAQHS